MWKTAKLGEITTISIGKTPSRSNSKLWDKEKKTKNIWLSIADLTALDNLYVKDSKEYVSDEGAKLIKVIPKGTLIMSFKLSIGKLAITQSELRSNEAIAALLIKDEKIISKKYLYYFLSSIDWDALAGNDIKVKGKTLNKAKLNEIPISFPPLSEQDLITTKLQSIFFEIDKMINSTEEILKNINSISNKYIDQIFSSVSGTKTTLEKVTSTITCGVAKRPSYMEKGIPFLSARNVKNGRMKWVNYKFIDEKTHLKLSKYNKPTIGDILYSRVGAGFGDAAIVDRDLEFSIFVSLTLIKTKKELNNEYLCHFLNSSFIKKLASLSITGTGVGNLNVSAVRKFPINLIPLDEQKEIVKKIDTYKILSNKLINIYTQKTENLFKLRDVILRNEIKS